MVTRILGALTLLLFLPGVYLTLADMLPAPHQEDFGACYVAARALANGESPYDAAVARRVAHALGVVHHSPYIYPPLPALLLRPLAAVPYRAAAWIWFLLSAGALVAALWLLRPVVRIPWRSYRWMCLAVFFLPPVHHTLQHGQITTFLFLLVMLSAVIGGAAGGVWVGIASALKVFPATLGVVYALSGRLAALAVMVASAAAMTVGAALVAPDATREFSTRVAPQLALDRRLAPNNQSVHAVTARWFEAHWFVTPIADTPWVGRIISSVTTAAVAVVTLWTLVSIRRVDGALVHLERMSLVLAATLIVSPIVWDHYYVLLLLPAAVLYRASREDRTIERLFFVGAILLLSHRYWPLTLAIQSPLLMSMGLAGVFVLWIALLKVLSYDRVCARSSPSATNRSAI